jgi:hypothetical protein
MNTSPERTPLSRPQTSQTSERWHGDSVSWQVWVRGGAGSLSRPSALPSIAGMLLRRGELAVWAKSGRSRTIQLRGHAGNITTELSAGRAESIHVPCYSASIGSHAKDR